MHIEHHSLFRDFPEQHEQLHSLRQSDPKFAELATQYEALDKQICRIEDGVELLAEDALTALKQQRVSLKDQVVSRLKSAAEPCCGCCQG